MPLIAKGSLPEKVEEENKGRQAHRDSPATAINNDRLTAFDPGQPG